MYVARNSSEVWGVQASGKVKRCEAGEAVGVGTPRLGGRSRAWPDTIERRARSVGLLMWCSSQLAVSVVDVAS